jgi:hypothetical protein
MYIPLILAHCHYNGCTEYLLGIFVLGTALSVKMKSVVSVTVGKVIYIRRTAGGKHGTREGAAF